MKIDYLFFKNRKFSAVVVFTFLFCLTQYLAFQRFQINEEIEAEKVSKEIHRIENNLTTLLSNSESATQTLAFVVEKYGRVGAFDSLAQLIISSNKYLDALQLTKNGVITEVYPLAGNEVVLGLDVLKDSQRKQEALRALRAKKLFFAGPLQLRQSKGLALVGRLPIFTKDKFYGFSIVLIKFSTFLKAAGIDTSANADFKYQVSKIDPNTKKEAFFLPASFSLTKDIPPYTNFPVADLRIYVKAIGHENRYAKVIWISISGIAISLASGFMAFYLLSLPEKLQVLVLEQTRRIETNEKYFRAIINNIEDAIVILDDTGKTRYHSPSSARITGYTMDELQLHNRLVLVHQDDREEYFKVFERVLQEPGRTSQVSYRLRHKNGNYVWIDGTFSNLLKDDVIGGIVFIFRDISHLKLAQEEIAKAYRENEATLNRITFGVISLDNELRYTYINDAALSTHSLGREGTIGKVIWDIHPEMKNDWFVNKFHEAKIKNVEVVLENYSKTFNKWFLLKIYPSADGLTLFYTDITNQKLVEAQIRKNELRLTETQALAKIGSWEINLIPRTVIWSRETFRILELDPEFFRPTLTSFFKFVHPEDRAKVNAAFKISSVNGALNITEHRIISSSGKVKWIEERWYLSQNHEGIVVLAFGTCQDITERKKSEDFVRKNIEEVRKLTVHLEKVREEERKRIAREIHDELGQQLTGLKMDVEWIAKKITSTSVVVEKIKEMIVLIDQTVVTIRRIVSELRPGVLDDLGLIPALEWQCKEFEKRSGIKCEAHFKLDYLEFSKDLSIHLFRIYQEALTNISRHAMATLVTMVLEEVDDYLVLTIRDNGVGMDKNKVSFGNSWGLVGMRERAAIFAGEMEINSVVNLGTVITIKIPLKIMAL